MLRRNLLLAVVLACYLCLATIYSAVVPLGEGPDESGHMAYVLFLVRNNRLPDQRKGTAGEVPGEGHQPPLAYLLMRPAAEWLPGRTRRVALTPDPNFVWRGGTSPAAFARGSQEYWPWRGVPLAWHLARIVSVLLGAVTVLCTWGLARLLHPTQPAVAFGAAALVAFNPQFLFSSALVSNDPLLTALSTTLLWLCAHLLCGRRSFLRVPPPVALGLLLGLTLITKQSALLLAPVALLTVVLLPAQNNTSGLQLWRIVRNTILFGLTTLAVAGWWYLRNWQMYGDPLGLAVFTAEFSTQPFAWRNPEAWLEGLSRLHASLWGTFGWMSVPSPAWFYWTIAAIEIVALVGLVRYLIPKAQPLTIEIEGGRQLLSFSTLQTAIVIVLALGLAFAWTVSFALTAGLVAWQGRFLFPAIAVIGLGLAWGLWAWGRTTLYTAVALVALLAALSPTLTIAPAYRWYTLPEPVARSLPGLPTYARFADDDRLGVELHAWQLSPQPLRAGSDATLELTWYTRSRIATNWIIFVHLVDSSDEIIFDSDAQPLAGTFPTYQWTPGDWLRDRRVLRLPTDLPPGRYTLRIGLFDAETQRRAPYFNDDDPTDTEGDAVDLAVVEVAP